MADSVEFSIDGKCTGGECPWRMNITRDVPVVGGYVSGVKTAEMELALIANFSEHNRQKHAGHPAEVEITERPKWRPK